MRAGQEERSWVKSGPSGDVVIGARDERWEYLSQGERGNCMADSVTDRLAGWLTDKQTGRTRRVWVHSSTLLPAGIDAALRSTKGLDE